MKTVVPRSLGTRTSPHLSAVIAPEDQVAALPKGPISVAQRVVVTLSDDIDGGEAAETVAFGLDGRMYEIDLSPTNAEKLRGALAPYVRAGRKRSKSGMTYHHTTIAPDPQTVRSWAQSHGYEVPARGRIPKRIYEAFSAAS
jgi:Lsr2